MSCQKLSYGVDVTVGLMLILCDCGVVRL